MPAPVLIFPEHGLQTETGNVVNYNGGSVSPTILGGKTYYNLYINLSQYYSSNSKYTPGQM